MCDQQSLRSVCAYAQSNQRLCWSLAYSMSVRLLTEHHLEPLSFKGGCTDSSESTLVKMPHCWKSHVAAHYVAQSKDSNQPGHPPSLIRGFAALVTKNLSCFVQTAKTDQTVRMLMLICVICSLSHIHFVDFSCHIMAQMGLDARKPVYGGLRTTQVQTSLRIRAV